MEDYEHIESRFNELGEQLEYAKKHPFKVPVDFDTRFRVWRDQVLKDRILQLDKSKSIRDAIRYYDLSVKDYYRLLRRATKEFMVYANNPLVPQAIFKVMQHIYKDRKESLQVVYNNFVDELYRIELRG